MAEIGIIASALQIADIGIRLSLRLYTFGETVASADKSIISISENVSLTSTVLKELGQTLDKDQTTRICSPNAVTTADSIVKQCQRIFQEMDHILVKKFAKVKSAEKDRKIKSAQTLERLRWPFIKGKIELLTSDLERQKSTLVLMLNVIALAKQEFEKTEASTTIAEQRSLIQDLARSNEGYIHKFEQLRLSCPDVPTNQEAISANCNDSIPTLQAPTAQGFASSSALGAASQRWHSTGPQDLRPNTYQGPYTFVPPPDGMRWLLQQYDNLLRALLKEVSEPNYEIAEESRSRIKADIVTSHGRETQHEVQVGYSGAPSLAKSSRFDLQITPTTNPAALNSSELFFHSMQPLNSGPEYYSRKPSRSPPAMTNFHDATRSGKEDDRPAQSEDQYQEIALTRKRKAPDSDLLAGRIFAAPESNRSLKRLKRQQPLPSTIQHSGDEPSRSRPRPPLPNLPSTVQHSEDEPLDPGPPILQQPFISRVQHSECDSPDPRPPLCLQLPVPSTVQHPEERSLQIQTRCYHSEHIAAVTEDIPTSESDVRDEMGASSDLDPKYPMFLGLAPPDVGMTARRVREITTQDSAENVVDRLLAKWTTLPVPASRNALVHYDSFAVSD